MDQLMIRPPTNLSLEDAATLLQIDKSSLRKFLASHPEIRDKYTYKDQYKGRRKTVITPEGLIVVANVKDKARNRGGKEAFNAPLDSGKQKIAEKALAPVTLPAEFANDPVISVRIQQIQLEKRVVTVEEDVKKIQNLLESPQLTKGQRDRLNERVRYLASQSGVSHSEIWTNLHGHLGRVCLDEYEFDDYMPAVRHLKTLYQKCKVFWNSLI